MQIVGKICAVCSARVVVASEGQACPTCSAPLHTACAAGHVCAAGAAPRKPSAVQPRSAWKRYRPLLAGLLGVLVASIVAPRIRSSQRTRAITERAAGDLACAASETTLTTDKGAIVARGCGRSVRYIHACGDVERRECLVGIEVVPGP